MSRARIVLPTVEPPAVLDDSWWMPLILFFSRLRDEGSCDIWLGDWDWREFMVMHGVERRPKPFLIEYKHVHTRRHVIVDRSGWAYDQRGMSGTAIGRFDRHKRLHDAFWRLDPVFQQRVRESERAHRGVDEWGDPIEPDGPDTSSDWLASPDPPAGPYDTWEPGQPDEVNPKPRRPRKPNLKIVSETSGRE